MLYYHLDRIGKLQVGQEIRLAASNPGLFFGYECVQLGLGHRGLAMTRDIHDKDFDEVSAAITEAYFELVRQHEFEKSLSRYQCIFVVEKLEGFLQWEPDFLDNLNSMIYQVDCDKASIPLDATHLNFGISLDSQTFSFNYRVLHNHALAYWRGEFSPLSPKFEILAQPPVKVVAFCGSLKYLYKSMRGKYDSSQKGEPKMTKVPKLFELMSEKKITQAELANNVDVSQGNISDWKSGRSSPSIDNIVKLADFFGVSTDYLLTGEKPQIKVMPTSLSRNEAEALSFINLLDEREQIMLIGELKERTKGRSATQEKVG